MFNQLALLQFNWLNMLKACALDSQKKLNGLGFESLVTK